MRHTVRELPPTADGIQASGNQQQGKYNDENSLKGFVDRRRRHAAKNHVGANHRRKHEVEREGWQYGDVAVQFPACLLVAQRVQSWLAGRWHCAGNSGSLELGQFVETVDRSAL